MLEIPLKELKDKLAEYDELTILEMLDITSAELVLYLADVIEDKQDELRIQLEDTEEEED